MRGRSSKLRAGCLLALLTVLGLLASGAPAGPAGAEPLAPERVVYLLQYVAVDYGLAVQEGAIASAFEYEEMRRFSRRLAGEREALAARGASPETLAGLADLEQRIAALAPWEEVRTLAGTLATALAEELSLLALPTRAPDLERGRRFYLRVCASCHGARGGGDGPAGAGLEPPPTAFDAPRMTYVSPHQVVGATRFGIEGTAMPAYADELELERLWDIAFFVMTLRSGFAPHAPERAADLGLADLALHPDAVLLARAREAGRALEPAHLDHYRASPGELRPVASEVPAPKAPTDAPRLAAAPDLQLALQLQGAFAAVAEAAGPSVVGVTGLVPRSGPGGEDAAGAWREGSLEERLYPDHAPARRGSGFFVADRGHVLTAHRLLLDAYGERVPAVDVELHDGRHRRARIVAAEPTIDLAVLALEEGPRGARPVPGPVRIGDSDALRVGHWTIALGDPPGPGRVFAVGTLSSSPERQCYQEELSATLMATSPGAPVGATGGPLLDIEGAVVGMLLPGPGYDAAGLVPPPPTIHYALPINLAMALYEPLVQAGSVRSPWLGFSVLELDRARALLEGSPAARGLPPEGVYIDDLFEPSPAAEAGVVVGDVLVAIDDHAVRSVGDFQRRLYLAGIGRSLLLTLERAGESVELHVTVEERPAAAVPR